MLIVLRWYGHVLRLEEERTSKKALNTKVNEKYPSGRLKSGWEEQVRKYVTQREGRSWGRN
jgi:hypothetical protein